MNVQGNNEREALSTERGTRVQLSDASRQDYTFLARTRHFHGLVIIRHL